MSIEENKAIARRLTEEVVNKGNLAVLDEVVDTNIVDHNPMIPDQAPGLEGAKQFFGMLRTAFPDWDSNIDVIIAEGDKVAVRFSGSGTHQGEFFGIPPTGKQVTTTGNVIYRIAGSKIVDQWINADMLGMLQQLGVVPPPGQA